jgi:hypothetical protein
MRVKTVAYLICFLMPLALPSAGLAQKKQTDNRELEHLKQQILELKRQLNEIENERKAKALRQEIEKPSQAGTTPEETKAEDEAAKLRQLAESLVGEKKEPEKTPEETVFKAGGLSLQKLNPEISVTGDFLFSSRQDTTSDKTTDFDFRTLGVHVESWLDPYTRFKAAIPVTESETKLGEGYVTLYQIAEDLNLTLGKFGQQFGVVNRWHKHGLDQVDFPLALRKIFGEGGLNQSGLSLDWLMPPAGKASQQLIFQVTDGENDRLFRENTHNRPSLLLHYKNFRDLSKDTYLEYGLTGLLGWNDEWDMLDGSKRDSRKITSVIGADLSVLWEPTEKMRYRNMEWRSEAYLLNKRLLTPDGSSDGINAWGMYSYLQSKISRTIDIGIRGDFFVPDTKSYADVADIHGTSLSLSPLAVTGKNPYLWQITPYITWWQSPFVKFRLEYDHADGKGIENPEDIIWLQAVFAAGPHKHERY